MRAPVLLILSFLAGPQPQAVGASDGETILVLGDSLSAAHDIPLDRGWVALLAELVAEHCAGEVVNASISGETTIGGRSRLPGLLDRHHPSIVILELGGNDGLRGQPVAELETNLAAMIEAAQGAGAEVLLLGIRIPSNYGRRYGEALAAVYPALAERFATALVPFLLEGIALDPALMQADQIHPRAEAQPRVLANVLPALRELAPACVPTG